MGPFRHKTISLMYMWTRRNLSELLWVASGGECHEEHLDRRHGIRCDVRLFQWLRSQATLPTPLQLTPISCKSSRNVCCQCGPRQSPDRKRILPYFEDHRTQHFVPIWQNMRETICISVPYSKLCVDLSRRDVRRYRRAYVYCMSLQTVVQYTVRR